MATRTIRTSFLAGVAAAALAAPAFAESTAAPISAPHTLDDIIVTAQRRDQRLQDVPIAVSVLTARALSDSGATSTDALSTVTPGLSMTRQLKGGTPFIRGVGTQSIGAGVESPVAQYVDGVYYMFTSGNIFSFNNIERVEVLKGPQGTLFGRNTTGGLIQVITRDPSPAESVEGSLSYGNYSTVEGSLYATGGSNDVSADIALYGIRNDGFGQNLTLGGRVNKLDEQSARAKFLWQPGADTRVTVAADYDVNHSDIGTTRNAVPGSLLLTGRPFLGTLYDTQAGVPGDIKGTFWGVSLHVDQAFGDFKLLSITAYRQAHSFIHFDQDAVPANFADVTVNERDHSFQQELLLTRDVGKLNLTTGLFYFHSENGNAPLVVRSATAASNTNSFTPQTLNSYAAFVDGTLALTATTNLTAGIRYTVDHRAVDAYQEAAAGNPRPVGTVLLTNINEATFRKPTFRVVVDQKLTPDVLLYGSFNRGFKSGVFNTGAIGQRDPVLPETVDAFEIGLKTESFDHQLRLNVAAFHNKLTGIQLTRQTLGAQTIFNAAAGRSQGGEAEAILTPHLQTGRLQITANFSVLSAKYTDFPLGQISVPNAAGGNAVVIGDLTGKQMIRSPKFTLSMGFDYSVPVGNVEVGLSANYFHSDKFYWEPDNRLVQNPYDLVNAQTYVAFGKDNRLRVRIFGKNLTNQRYYSYVSAGGLGDLAAPAPPRTYGAGIDFKF